jgi:integrase
MVYSFARIGAALGMAVEDVFTQYRRLWVRLREKGGKRHAMPCHHTTNISSRISTAPACAAIPRGRCSARSAAAPASSRARFSRKRTPMRFGRRAAAAGIATKLGNHSFRATGITAYLKNGGTLEKAAAMANHASKRTTRLYDRRRDELSLDEVERIVI